MQTAANAFQPVFPPVQMYAQIPYAQYYPPVELIGKTWEYHDQIRALAYKEGLETVAAEGFEPLPWEVKKCHWMKKHDDTQARKARAAH